SLDAGAHHPPATNSGPARLAAGAAENRAAIAQHCRVGRNRATSEGAHYAHGCSATHEASVVEQSGRAGSDELGKKSRPAECRLCARGEPATSNACHSHVRTCCKVARGKD